MSSERFSSPVSISGELSDRTTGTMPGWRACSCAAKRAATGIVVGTAPIASEPRGRAGAAVQVLPQELLLAQHRSALAMHPLAFRRQALRRRGRGGRSATPSSCSSARRAFESAGWVM